MKFWGATVYLDPTDTPASIARMELVWSLNYTSSRDIVQKTGDVEDLSDDIGEEEALALIEELKSLWNGRVWHPRQVLLKI